MTSETLPEFPHLQGGELSASQGRWDEALMSFQRAKEANPRSGPAWQGLSVAFHRLGRVEDSWTAAIQAWRLDPQDPDNMANLSDLARELGRERQLAEVVRNAESPSAWALCGSGESQVREDRHQEAFLTFIQALDLDPALPRAWCGIGVACFRQGYVNASRAFFEMAVRLDPADEDSVLNWAETCQETISGEQVVAALSSMGVAAGLLSRAVSLRRG
jgi:Flp pilus assembly protein TadD